jgi:hypothetical protein
MLKNVSGNSNFYLKIFNKPAYNYCGGEPLAEPESTITASGS